MFATANSIERISKPLQSRFRKLVLPKYTEAQFLQVAQKVLPRLTSRLTEFIARCVWQQKGDVISIGKLVRNDDEPGDVLEIVNTIYRYSYFLRFRINQYLQRNRNHKSVARRGK